MKRQDEKKIATSKLSGAAKEAMKEWKAKTGIKAIVPKTDQQKREAKKYRQRLRTHERAELRKISHGPASPVRIIKLDE